MVGGGATPAKIRTLIVIDVRLYREGLTANLCDRECLFVAGTAGSRADALLAVHTHTPDVVIIDVALAQSLDLMRDLRAQTPATRIVAFAVDEDVSAILDCAEAGAAGFVTANASVDDLVDAIVRTTAGELLCSPRMAAELLRRAANGRDEPPSTPLLPSALTGREKQVLLFLQQGLANKEIAIALNIAESTVKNHVHHLLEKMQVPNRSQAAAHAHTAAERVSMRQRRATVRLAG